MANSEMTGYLAAAPDFLSLHTQGLEVSLSEGSGGVRERFLVDGGPRRSAL